MEIIYHLLSHLTTLEKPLDHFIIDLLGITPAHEHVLRTVGRGSSDFLPVAIAGFIPLQLFGTLDDTIAEVGLLV